MKHNTGNHFRRQKGRRSGRRGPGRRDTPFWEYGSSNTSFPQAFRGLDESRRDMDRKRWRAKWKGIAERRGGKVEKIIAGFRDTIPGGRRGLARRLHRKAKR